MLLLARGGASFVVGGSTHFIPFDFIVVLPAVTGWEPGP